MKARPNLVLLVVAGLVLVLLVVAAVVASTRTAPEPDRATPDGTVQLFIRALYERDDDAAVALLDPDLGCEAPLQFYVGDAARVGVVNVTTTDDRATVVVEVTEETGAGIGDSWSHRETYRLTRVDGAWLITGEPWPVYQCIYEKVVD